jgi:hypothetical protein
MDGWYEGPWSNEGLESTKDQRLTKDLRVKDTRHVKKWVEKLSITQLNQLCHLPEEHGTNDFSAHNEENNS